MRLYWQAAGMIVGSVFVMLVLGAVMIRLFPPSELERACVSKPLLELGQCLYDEKARQR